ncbi:carboxylating nicotinate-nucleotide diphosphorylase [Clostridium cylindrosporum]|uniref:Probable nicotinate-nucleotide pyrophosphorylase [carboxylating] n=1 Tax=Clostridium cylindrosporum DSM 605 TaxID=1121307 RepID=A0A0J8D519_CLOCY|nr:carboxylating nicotinate-nucleotide diphosphorylase [Clostridium cylindrosporum]KMT20912.1 putative nicotinate-nucleotide pyrophosphorylase [Clostridium cylindrosporum DSM 605]
MLDRFLIIDIIKNALIEDMNAGDLSSNLIDNEKLGSAAITAKEDGIVSGISVAKETFRFIDEDIKFTSLKEDGENVFKGEDIIIIEGKLISILKAERVALNFLQRMSGIATKAKMYAEKVSKYNVKIVDTRKTTPGLRILEKYSVRIGGCYNHRYNLSDGVMIKDNHIKALGGIKSAVQKAKSLVPHTSRVEVEVSNLLEVQEAIDSNADIIMLDNMNLEDMKKAVEMINKKCIVEASGNVTLNTVEGVASVGVDIISVGELTHSVKSLDLSLNIKG